MRLHHTPLVDLKVKPTENAFDAFFSLCYASELHGHGQSTRPVKAEMNMTKVQQGRYAFYRHALDVTD